VLAIRESLKQEATKVATNPIQDSRANLLEDGGNDTVQSCDTTQVRSDSDFGVKSATVQVYGNSHNSQSDRWTDILCGLSRHVVQLWFKIQFNRSLERHHNTGQ